MTKITQISARLDRHGQSISDLKDEIRRISKAIENLIAVSNR